jgi:exosortase
MTTSIPVLAPAPSRHAEPVGQPVARLATVGVVTALAFLPLLAQHGRQMWDRPHYQFVPLVPLGAAVLLASRLRGLGPLTPGSWLISLGFLAVSWALLLVGEMLTSPWFAAVAVLVLAASGLYAAGGVRLFRAALPAWVLMWLAVPPPLQLDNQLVLGLQSLTARWSSAVLDLLGVFHVMAGHVVELGGRRLLVEQACSGVNSLFAVLACTVFYVFLTRRPAVQAVLVVVAGIFWVLVANVARVVVVAVASARWGVDLTEGWRHDVLGFGLFAAALGLIWSTNRLLLFLTAPIQPAYVSRPTTEDAPATLWPDLRTTWLAGPAPLLGFGLLAALHWVAVWQTPAGPAYHPNAVAAGLDRLTPEALPPKWEGWPRLPVSAEDFTKQRNPGSAFGEFSKMWPYAVGTGTALVSLDYPFPGWHDLTSCYTTQGWSVDAQEVLHRDGPGGKPRSLVQVQLSKPAYRSYRSGHLLFCEFDRRGEFLEARRGGAHLTLETHRNALTNWWDRVRGVPTPRAEVVTPVYQLQLFVETHAPLTADQVKHAEGLFLHALDTLRAGWSAPHAATSPPPAR